MDEPKTARFRTYVDGKLAKSSACGFAQGQRWLDACEQAWSRNLGPLAGPGEFDPNQGHEVKRVSPEVLEVTTTGNRKLRFVLVQG